jgi:hypothetical protein
MVVINHQLAVGWGVTERAKPALRRDHRIELLSGQTVLALTPVPLAPLLAGRTAPLLREIAFRLAR